MDRITHFDGLYGEAGPRPDGEYLFSELLETRSENFDWKIRPHIHTNLYQVFLIETRKTEFLGNGAPVMITGPTILLIPPLTIHGFDYSQHTNGRILTISDKLVNSLFAGGSGVLPMLGQLQVLHQFTSPYTFKYVIRLVEALHDELFSNRQEKQQMLTVHLQQLFLVLYRIWRENATVTPEADIVSLAWYRKFQKKIGETGAQRSTGQYAKELGITAVHLNRICNSVAGKPAHQLLQDHLLDEAKKHLRYTSYTVAEIAYLLNFEYPNYFARFFKKATGLSPSEFRKQ